MRWCAVILIVAVSACVPSARRAQRLALLNEIATKCQVPKSTFKLVGLDELHFQPTPDTKFERVDCALGELRKSPFPMNLGFVDNEVYEPASQAKAPQ